MVVRSLGAPSALAMVVLGVLSVLAVNAFGWSAPLSAAPARALDDPAEPGAAQITRSDESNLCSAERFGICTRLLTLAAETPPQWCLPEPGGLAVCAAAGPLELLMPPAEEASLVAEAGFAEWSAASEAGEILATFLPGDPHGTRLFPAALSAAPGISGAGGGFGEGGNGAAPDEGSGERGGAGGRFPTGSVEEMEALTPVPAPPAVALLLGGLASLLGMRRLRRKPLAG